MTEVERLAEFVNRVKYRAISERARGQLKLHVLDSLGCAIGALAAEPIAAIRTHLELRRQYGFTAAAVAQLEIEIFDVAHRIIGGGEDGDKTTVRTKEEADHSLQYMIAAALCDGELLPRQYAPKRILASDVQHLLQQVTVRPNAEFSARFPEEMPCRVAINLEDGRRFEIEKRDYEGFHSRPMSWDSVVRKFHDLAVPRATPDQRSAIARAVSQLDNMRVRELTALLAQIGEAR